MDVAAVHLILENHPFRPQADSVAEREPIIDAIVVRAALVADIEIRAAAVGMLPRSYKIYHLRIAL
jgi:hypothetical protein